MPKGAIGEVFILAQKIGRIHEPWMDAKTGLHTQATLIRDQFFKQAERELEPTVIVFEQGLEGPEGVVLTPHSGGDGFKDAFPLLIRALAQKDNFLGAVMAVEGYVTNRDITALPSAPGVRKECLVQTLYGREGVLELWTTPFHRGKLPCLPIKDGETEVMDAKESPISGRMVPSMDTQGLPARGAKQSRMDN